MNITTDDLRRARLKSLRIHDIPRDQRLAFIDARLAEVMAARCGCNSIPCVGIEVQQVQMHSPGGTS